MLVSKKKFNEKLEHLLGSLKFYKNREENTLKIIENKNGDSLSCMKSLATIYETTASKALLVDKDIESFRKNKNEDIRIILQALGIENNFKIQDIELLKKNMKFTLSNISR